MVIGKSGKRNLVSVFLTLAMIVNRFWYWVKGF